MKFKTKRDDEPQEVTTVTIYIGLERFRLSESVDGKLTINKYSDGDSDLLQIFPRTGNEIELK
jgi:hypothetical protein